MAISSLHQLLYSRAWDTRCRSVDVSRVINPLLGERSSLLDAGCGEYGLAGFVSARCVGVDLIENEKGRADEITFVRGSIISLPFSNRSFTVAASVDVMEHLPAGLRPAAVKEVMAVADRAVVIAFPTGVKARQADEAFRDSLAARSQPLPEWLDEHLRAPYPEVEAVVSTMEKEAAAQGRKINISVFPSEDLSIARLLRWSAAHSRYLYLFLNLLTGMMLPLFPAPRLENCYRMVILAEFEND